MLHLNFPKHGICVVPNFLVFVFLKKIARFWPLNKYVVLERVENLIKMCAVLGTIFNKALTLISILFLCGRGLYLLMSNTFKSNPVKSYQFSRMTK